MPTLRKNLTSQQALDELERLYDGAVDALRDAITAFIATAACLMPHARSWPVCLSAAARHLGRRGPLPAPDPRLWSLYPRRQLQHHHYPPGPAAPLPQRSAYVADPGVSGAD